MLLVQGTCLGSGAPTCHFILAWGLPANFLPFLAPWGPGKSGGAKMVAHQDLVVKDSDCLGGGILK